MKDPRIEPDAVERDPDAVEMASIWIAEGGLHCTLKIGMYEDNNINEWEVWGLLLSDVIRHIANGLHQSYGYDRSESERTILEYLLKEIDIPTSDLNGSIIN